MLVGLYPDDDGGITTLQDMLVDIELDRNEELQGEAQAPYVTLLATSSPE